MVSSVDAGNCSKGGVSGHRRYFLRKKKEMVIKKKNHMTKKTPTKLAYLFEIDANWSLFLGGACFDWGGAVCLQYKQEGPLDKMFGSH